MIFHLIFNPEVPADDIETFLKGLKVKGTSIAGKYTDGQSLLDEVSVDFSETCKALRADGTFANQFLVWIPYDEYGGIDTINPATDALFKERACLRGRYPRVIEQGASGFLPMKRQQIHGGAL